MKTEHYAAFVYNLASGDGASSPAEPTTNGCADWLHENVKLCTGEAHTEVVDQYMRDANGRTSFTIETPDDIFVFGIVGIQR